jgi:sporulation protein YlmC with PRC-barrel domain
MAAEVTGPAGTTPVVPGRRYDAALHLLDRQLVDPDGRLVGKVDDLEVEEIDGGRLAVSAVLTGPGALAPRMHGRLGEWIAAVWKRLHPAEDPRPGRIPAGDLVRVSSAVHLGRHRSELAVDGFERWVRHHVVERLPGAPADNTPDDHEPPVVEHPAPLGASDDEHSPRRRMVDILGRPVLAPDGAQLGFLGDVRLAPTARVDGVFPRLVVDGLIVDGRHVGSMLGYERRAEQRPWLLRWVVRRIHRHAGYLPWESVTSVDWEAGVVRVARTDLDPLDVATR